MEVRLVHVAMAALLLAGSCRSPHRQHGEVASVQRGEVISYFPTGVAGANTGIVATLGSASLYSAGYKLGGSWETALIGGAVGAALGAGLGASAEQKLTETSGWDVLIRLDDGSEVQVTLRDEYFKRQGIHRGDRVVLTASGSKTEVRRE